MDMKDNLREGGLCSRCDWLWYNQASHDQGLRTAL